MLSATGREKSMILRSSGLPEDAVRVPQVAGDEDHAGQAVKISAAPREHNRVIINVGDSRVRVMLSGKLMDIAPGGEAGSYVNELRRYRTPRQGTGPRA